MSKSLLTRTLNQGKVGDDVFGSHRSVARLLDAHDHGHRLADLEDNSPAAKRTFGPAFKIDVNKARKAMGFKATGLVDQTLWAALMKGGWPDARAIELMNSYIDAHPALTLCFPVPLGEMGTVCQGIHETAGLDGNMAIDFCSPPGTHIVAVEAGTVTKLSGHNPNDDTWDSQGVFGWTVHFRTPSGYRYFVTHLGIRTVSLGQKLEMGQTLGRVGDQKFRPDHCHYGVTSPISTTDAKKRITAVSRAPRVD